MLTWKEVSENEWTAPISSDSHFQIVKAGEEFNLKVVAEILENNSFDMPFPSLEEAKNKAEDLIEIFNDFLTGSAPAEEEEDV
jgi:hypothetical protein